MTIRCGACGRAINVPDERAANPRLKIKCSCGAVFAISEAARATPAAAPPAAPAVPRATPAVAPAAPTAAAPARSASPPAATGAPRPQPPGTVAPVRPAPASLVRPPAASAPARPAAGQAAPRAPSPARAAAGLPATATPVVAPAAPRPGAWRRCAKHPQQRTESLCTNCMVGYCTECVQLVQNVAICPACDGLCTPIAKYEESLHTDTRRQRSMFDDLGVILGYPFVDPLAYVMLAIFTGVFGLMAKYSPVGGGGGILLSQGVLYWYCFNALSKAAIGNTRQVMPEFRDIDDIARPLRLGFAAFAASSLPLLLLLLFGGMEVAGNFLARNEPPQSAVVYAQEEGSDAVGSEEGEPAEEEGAATQEEATPAPGGRELAEAEEPAEGEGHGGMLFLLLALSVLWKLVYTPVALIVAGLSRSMLSTLNPIIGADSIRRMGGVYWQAMAIYTALTLAQWTLTFVLKLLPVAGDLIGAFVDAYVYLCIGCCLGLAVFKKAKELAWD